MQQLQHVADVFQHSAPEWENVGNMKVFWAVNPEELHQREQSCNLVSFLEFEVIYLDETGACEQKIIDLLHLWRKTEDLSEEGCPHPSPK